MICYLRLRRFHQGQLSYVEMKLSDCLTERPTTQYRLTAITDLAGAPCTTLPSSVSDWSLRWHSELLSRKKRDQFGLLPLVALGLYEVRQTALQHHTEAGEGVERRGKMTVFNSVDGFAIYTGEFGKTGLRKSPFGTQTDESVGNCLCRCGGGLLELC